MILSCNPEGAEVTIGLGNLFLEDVDAVVVVVNSPAFEDLAVFGSYAGFVRGILDNYKQTEECLVGSAVLSTKTGIFSNHVIYTVAPICGDDIKKSKKQLENCYLCCLTMAFLNDSLSIALPNIGEEVFGFPADIAIEAALDAAFKFCDKYHESFKEIRFSLDRKQHEAFIQKLKERGVFA